MTSHNASTTAMERNLRLYPWYIASYNAFFWMPIFFLYFSAHLPLAKVLQLEGIYYIAIVLLEVPSGYFSDRIGRRTTLLLSSILLVGAYLLFFVGSSFSYFAAAEVILAAGVAFNSGTDTSFHYDSLSALEREDEYKEREAIAARNALVATGLAAFVGGAVASIDLRYAYALSALAGVGALGLVAAFTEPSHQTTNPTAHFARQILNCLAHLKQPTLAWLFGFSVLAVVIDHIPYEFYQPYLELLGTRAGFNEHTAIAAGAHMAIATLIGAWVARRSARIDTRLGTARTLMLAALIQLLIIAAMTSFLHIAVLGLLLLRGVPSALYTAPLYAAVIPRIPQKERATYLSIQSLVGRLGFSALLASLALVADATQAGSWPVLSRLLLICTAMGLLGFLALLMSLRSAWNPPRSTDT